MASVSLIVYLYIIIFCRIFKKCDASENDTKAHGAAATGDVVIGGIFPIHRGVATNEQSFAPHVHTCVGLKTVTVALTLAMINAIEKMNRSPLLMDANVTLGYQIQDSCTDVSTGLRATADFIQQAQCDATCEQPVVAIIGAAFSEMSIAVARQLTLDMIPQISYSSTAVTLSDKRRFPSFMRTVPNDEHQTAAMVRLLNLNGWNWVGIVVTDGDYGRSALERFASQASLNGICIAFRSILPHSGTEEAVNSAIKRTALTISRNPKAQVIISFAASTHMRDLYQEMKNTMLKTGQIMGGMKRVWVASDSWSSSGNVQGDLTLEEIGHVVGFNFKTGNMLSFYEYLSQLETTGYNNTRNNTFLEEFFKLVNESRLSGDTDLVSEVVKTLKESTNKALTLSVEMAVSAIAQAVASICRSRDCKTPGSLQPWEVLEALWMHEFEHQGKTYAFDNQGDINQGYDVTMWTSLEGKIQIKDVVAEYLTHDNSFIVMDSDTAKRFQDLQQIVSRCSNSCMPGEFKKTAEGEHTCCYECINCTENYFSNDTDMDQCLSCDVSKEWSPKGSSTCLPKRLIYFSWHDRFAVVLLTFSSLGILLVVMVSALFLHQRDTPVVKAAGGPLSQVILFSLVVSFISAVLFVGKANHLQCKMRQVLFGISFTLCVSCILVKSLKILLAFQLNINVQGALRKVYQSALIVIVCVGVQAAICICWLVLKSPYSHIILQPQTILQDCYEGSYLIFGVMLGYIALLAFVCFICAFIGRKLPQRYNEAKFITFSMLLYLISWLLFIPVYITTSGVYLPAVEMVVILMSNYGILGCHFFPKCYIMLFRKDQNTCSAFREKLYQYNVKSTDSVYVSGSSTSEKSFGSQTVSSCSSLSLPKDDIKPAVEKRDICKVSYKGPINKFGFHRRSISF
ncbi:G-protein coupled receptor family C group 6 member A [Dunckerocampus dactyliophorus]|uniref:G-protein coupled receptor family C group 6 member A n=1 Tax=Dunckerocampus dactyliophorus TaxID=161453 RepID=UPI0024060AB6|nr:G-protein coupled receptor family C group 6 member A [Dunckerocampus dactyliophorus]